MKKAFVFLGILFLPATMAADDVSDSLNGSKSFYWAGNYHSALMEGAEAMDLIFQTELEALLPLIPVLDGMNATETNYFYSFGGEYGNFEAYFELELVQSDGVETVSLRFDNSLTTIDMAKNYILSYEYLDTKPSGYVATNYSTTYSTYECLLRENFAAYLPFSYSEDNGATETGLVIIMDFEFPDWYTESKKLTLRDTYIMEVLAELKTGTIKNILE